MDCDVAIHALASELNPRNGYAAGIESCGGALLQPVVGVVSVLDVGCIGVLGVQAQEALGRSGKSSG